MAASNQTVLSNSIFNWAEPLICEQVLNTYEQGDDRARDAGLVGKVLKDQIVGLHTQMWLSLIEGDETGFIAKRGKLARLITEARLSPTQIDRADRAVLLELVLVVVTRFRSSERVRSGYIERLQKALRAIRANPSYTLH
jgi:hypothetical protein